MSGAIVARLPDGRLHLQEGPIDLVIEAFGAVIEVERAYAQAVECFGGVLSDLVRELPTLRRPVGEAAPQLRGPVARRMAEAVWPHRAVFITPMAAVAGAVADEVLQALVRDRTLEKAYVNDGGDIAIHLAPGQRLRAGIVGDLHAPQISGFATLHHDRPVRGIATSVLAATAAAADAAATLIANAVNVDTPAIRRQPACEIDPDSDLGGLPVTVAVGELSPALVAEALDRGVLEARRLRLCGIIDSAALSLKGHWRIEADDKAIAEARMG